MKKRLRKWMRAWLGVEELYANQKKVIELLSNATYFPEKEVEGIISAARERDKENNLRPTL